MNTPYTGKVTVHAGIYAGDYGTLDRHYCTDAKFANAGDNTTGLNLQAILSGRDGFDLTSSDGTYSFLTDPDQWNYGGRTTGYNILTDSVAYIIEMVFEDLDGVSYEPLLIESGPGARYVAVYLREAKTPHTPVIGYQTLQQFFDLYDEKTSQDVKTPLSYPIDTKYSTGSVGISRQYYEAVLNTLTLFDGYQHLVGKTAAPSADTAEYSKITDGTELGAIFIGSNGMEPDGQHGSNGSEVDGQHVVTDPLIVTNLKDINVTNPDSVTNSVYVYPFSTMQVVRNHYLINKETLGRHETPTTTQSEDGTQFKYYEYDFIGYQESTTLTMQYKVDSASVKNELMPYTLINLMDEPEVTTSVGTDEVAEKAEGVVNDFADPGSIFDMVPVNDMLKNGFLWLASQGGAGNSMINISIFPTEDPATFDIMVTIGNAKLTGSVEDELIERAGVGGAVDTAYEVAQSLQEAKQAYEELEHVDQLFEPQTSSKFSFEWAGILTAQVVLDLPSNNWDFIFTGGQFLAKAAASFSYTQNFMISVVPVTLSFEVGGGANLVLGVETQLGPSSAETNVDFIIDLLLNGYVKAFAGIGFDFSVICLKIGIFGEIGIETELLFKVSTGDQGTSGDTGQRLAINGEIGIKMEAKILFISYEQVFASTKFGWEWIWNNYDQLKAQAPEMLRQEGFTLEGDPYTAVVSSSGDIDFVINSQHMESRDYLYSFTRSWNGGNQGIQTFSLDAGGGAVSSLQTNAYPDSNPVYTDDGQMLLFISDSNSTDLTDTMVSYAKLDSNGKYSSQGNIYSAFGTGAPSMYYVESGINHYYNYACTSDPQPYTGGTAMVSKIPGNNVNYQLFVDGGLRYVRASDVKVISSGGGPGDSSVTASGTDGDYFAAWVSQFSPVSKAAGDEAGSEDTAMMVNSSEVMAAVWDNAQSAWNETRLTENGSGDLAPVAASSGKKAIVAWRNLESSSSDDPLSFDVTDNLMYRIYNGTDWADASIAYNGAAGHINALDAKMAEDGSAIITYTVKTDDEDAASTETFYTIINADGTVGQTVRLTNNSDFDVNAQAAVVKNGSDEQFLVSWYSEHDSVKDISLALINKDGTIDVNFIDSVAGVTGQTFTSSYNLTVKKDGGIGDVVLTWTEPVREESGNVYSVLKAVKLCVNGGTLTVSSAQEVAKMPDKVQVDRFDTYMDGSGKLYAAILGSDYQNTDTSTIGTVDMNDLLERITGDTPNFSEDPDDSVLSILAQTPVVNMYTASYEFGTSYTVSDPFYNKQSIYPGFELPVQFTITNTGTTEITGITAAVGAVTATDAAAKILPGQSASIVVYYVVNEGVVTNPEYIVNAGTGVGGDVATGTLTLNIPDVGISEVKLMREEGGERDFRVTLLNSSNIPLVGNEGKEVKVGFYASPSSDVPLATAAIGSNAYVLIDNGGYSFTQTIDAEAMNALATVQDAMAEGEFSGNLRIYVRAWIEENGEKAEELYVRNNDASISFKGLLEKAGEPLTIQATSYNMVTDDATGETTSADVAVVLRSNSLQGQNIGNIKVDLIDENGHVIAFTQTYDGTAIDLTKEQQLSKEFTIDLTDVEDTDSIASVKAYIYTDKANVEFDLGGFGEESDIPESQDITLGEKATKPNDPMIDNYDFKGWYKDAELTEGFEFEDEIITYDIKLYASFELAVYAEVSNITVTGERLSDITEADVELNLTNASFKDLNVDDNISTYFKNLPTGLTAKIKSFDNDNETMTVTISGKPTVKALASKMTFEIPFSKVTPVETVNDPPTYLEVKANDSAKYNIVGTVLNLDEAAQTFTYTGTAKDFVIKEDNNYTTTGYTVKYQQSSIDASPIKAGSYDVVITRAEDNNYSAYSKTIIGGLVIDKAEASVSAVAAPNSTVYENDVTITASVTGITQPTGKVQFYVNGAKEGGEQVIDAAGSASITITSPPATTYNYKAEYLGDDNFATKTSVESEFSVDKASFVSGTDYSTNGKTVTYDGNKHNITVEVKNKAQNASVEYSSDGITYGAAPITYKDAGTYTVYYKITMDNWNEVKGSEQVIINQRVAELSWSGYATRVYNDTASNVGAVVTNLAQGDTAADVTVTVEDGTKTDAGTYTATAAGLSSSNYSLPETVTKDYEITKRPVTITVDPAEKMINSPDPTFTFTIDGDISGSDDIVVTLSRIEGKFAGNYAIVGTFNDNYEVTFMGNYLTIKKLANDPIPNLYTVNGTVINNGTTGDVTVTIMQGNKIFGISSGMSYSFSNLAEGAYNITATNGTESKTVYIELTGNMTKDIIIGMQTAEIIVKGDDTPPVVVSVTALENILDDNSLMVSLQLVVENKEAVPNKISTMARSAGKTIAFNLDFTIWEDGASLSTYEFDELIKVTFPIPDIAKGKLITIYRLHDGLAEAMPTAPKNVGDEYVEIGTDMIILHIKKFSDYAVGYSTPRNTDNGGGISIVNALAPRIITQPVSASVTSGKDKILSVIAGSLDYGTLSYQWYVNTTEKNTGGTAIDGATKASYTVQTSKAGKYYYYVVVTNTNKNVIGSKTVSKSSDVVTVTVTEKEEKTKQFTVTYKANGGGKVTGMPSDKAKYDSESKVTVIGIPISTSKFFAGWNTKADGTGKLYTAGKTFKITENVTLYAQWRDTITSKAKITYKVTGKYEVVCIGTTAKNAKTITIADTFLYKGITYKVTSIAKNAFRGNEKVTTVIIGNNVKLIHNTAFYKCPNLKKVTIGTGLVTLNNDVFCHAKDGLVITINSTKLTTMKTAINHGIKKMVVKVPKSKLDAYKKLFAEKSKTVKVEAK